MTGITRRSFLRIFGIGAVAAAAAVVAPSIIAEPAKATEPAPQLETYAIARPAPVVERNQIRNHQFWQVERELVRAKNALQRREDLEIFGLLIAYAKE